MDARKSIVKSLTIALRELSLNVNLEHSFADWVNKLIDEVSVGYLGNPPVTLYQVEYKAKGTKLSYEDCLRSLDKALSLIVPHAFEVKEEIGVLRIVGKDIKENLIRLAIDDKLPDDLHQLDVEKIVEGVHRPYIAYLRDDLGEGMILIWARNDEEAKAILRDETDGEWGEPTLVADTSSRRASYYWGQF